LPVRNPEGVVRLARTLASGSPSICLLVSRVRLLPRPQSSPLGTDRGELAGHGYCQPAARSRLQLTWRRGKDPGPARHGELLHSSGHFGGRGPNVCS
jgi:hypothetical protein